VHRGEHARRRRPGARAAAQARGEPAAARDPGDPLRAGRALDLGRGRAARAVVAPGAEAGALARAPLRRDRALPAPQRGSAVRGASRRSCAGCTPPPRRSRAALC
jgi:hypothetical protein